MELDSTSFIQRLPPELLLEIWSIICDRNAIKPTSQFLELPALTLSMVCSTWRTITLSSPALWASFQVRLVAKTASDPGLDGMLQLLRTYLSNSKQIPLKLDLCVHASEQSRTDSRVCQIITCLLQESHRWYNAIFDLGLSDTHSQFTRIRGNLPLLECVTLRFDGHGVLSDLLQSSPKLHTFIYNGTREIEIPQHQLEDIHFLGSDIERLQNHVSSCFNLERLVSYADFDKVAVQAGVTTSTSLKSLTVFTKTLWNREIPIWNLFTFPNLQELDIWMAKPSRPDKPSSVLSVQDISRFLTRSACHLTKLSMLDLQDLEDAGIIALLLSLVPSLVTLVIHEERRRLGYKHIPPENHPTSPLTEILNVLYVPPCQDISQLPPRASTPHFPNLQNIELAVNSDVILTLLPSIKRMIETRVYPHDRAHSTSISALRNLELIIWDSEPDLLRADGELFDSLHALNRDGLALSVYYK